MSTGSSSVTTVQVTFLDQVEAEFGSRDLYSVLGVERGATDNELKRAYHRLSLRVHPDRVEPGEVDAATKKFQVRMSGCCCSPNVSVELSVVGVCVVCVRARVAVCVHVCASMCVCMYSCMHVYEFVCMCGVCVHVNMCVSV